MASGRGYRGRFNPFRDAHGRYAAANSAPARMPPPYPQATTHQELDAVAADIAALDGEQDRSDLNGMLAMQRANLPPAADMNARIREAAGR